MKISEVFQLRQTIDNYNNIGRALKNVQNENRTVNNIFNELFVLGQNGVDANVEVFDIVKSSAVSVLLDLLNAEKKKLELAGIEMEED